MTALEITDENFDQLVIESAKVAMIDFGAAWCPPCNAMTPAVEKLAHEFDGKAIVGKVDVDTSPEITAKYRIRNLPTFLIFKDGELVDRVVGAVPGSALQVKLSAFL